MQQRSHEINFPRNEIWALDRFAEISAAPHKRLWVMWCMTECDVWVYITIDNQCDVWPNVMYWSTTLTQHITSSLITSHHITHHFTSLITSHCSSHHITLDHESHWVKVFPIWMYLNSVNLTNHSKIQKWYGYLSYKKYIISGRKKKGYFHYCLCVGICFHWLHWIEGKFLFITTFGKVSVVRYEVSYVSIPLLDFAWIHWIQWNSFRENSIRPRITLTTSHLCVILTLPNIFLCVPSDNGR